MVKSKFYIAFSIAGTNAFITATKEMDAAKLPVEFKVVKSRRDNPTDTKLEWRELMTKAGVPLRSPQLVISRFNALVLRGWKVSKEAFVAKHFPKKK